MTPLDALADWCKEMGRDDMAEIAEAAKAEHAAPIDLGNLQVELHPLAGHIDDVAGKAVAIAGRLGGTVYLVFNDRRIEVRNSGMTPRMVSDHYWSLVDRGGHGS